MGKFIINNKTIITGSLYVTGSLYFNNDVVSQSISPYGGSYNTKHWTEIIQLNTPNTLYSSTYQIPQGSVCLGVVARVLGTFVSGGVFALGVTGSSDWAPRWGSNINSTINTTNITSSMQSGFEYYSVNTNVQISCSIAQGIKVGGNTGSVRIETRWNELQVPNI